MCVCVTERERETDRDRETETESCVRSIDLPLCWGPLLPECSVLLFQLQNRYGDVFSLQMGWKPVVVINGLKAVRELLVTCGEDTADRPLLPIYNHLGYGHKSKGKAL